MDSLWEDQIKNAVLHNKQLFTTHYAMGQSLIIYEKRISKHVIADCLIFSSHMGIIGVEIKTEHDTLKRLPHQLDAYVRTCGFTYVFCHDSKVKAVNKLIEQKHYDCVGIISYEQYKGQPLAGLVKTAYFSPYVSSRGINYIMWHSELANLVKSAEHKHYKGWKNKYTLEMELSNLFSDQELQRIVANMYIKNEISYNKPLQRWHFGQHYDHDTSFKR